MTQSSYIRPINNDRMGTLMAFRPPVQESRPRSLMTGTSTALPGAPTVSEAQQAQLTAGVAAPALHSAPPRPTQLNDAQAEVALDQVQQQAADMMQAHSNLDAARVARLLGLLE